MRARHIVSGTTLVLLTSCASYTPTEVADPAKISLTDALKDVVRSLNESHELAQNFKSPTGLEPCSATAVFNVSAKATNATDYQLGITVSPPGVPISGNASGKWDASAEGNRGNTVTVVLTSPACVPDGSLGASHPDKIALAQKQINEARKNGYLSARGVRLPELSHGNGTQKP